MTANLLPVVFLAASSALAQLAADPPIDGDRIVAEWKRMLICYVESYPDRAGRLVEES